MAYHDIPQHSQVLIEEITRTRHILSRLGGGFMSIMRTMAENSYGQRRVNMVMALQAKSDAELAALKIKREDIVQHVFRDLV